MPSGVKKYHNSAHFSVSHDRPDDKSIHHKPRAPQITSVFKPSHIMVRSGEERFTLERMAPEASAPWRSRWRLVCRNRQRSAGCGGCARTATWRRATSGDRAVRRLVCVSCLFCILRLTSLGVSCVPLFCGSMAVMKSAFLPQRSSTPGFLLIGFLWFLAVSLFFQLYWLFGVICHASLSAIS